MFNLGECYAPNEEYSLCGAHGCLNTCEEPNLITYCDPAPGCYPGCICAEGYLRNAKGVCVKSEECEGKHEVFNNFLINIKFLLS